MIYPHEVELLSSHLQTSGSHYFIYLTCQRGECEAKRKSRKWITKQNGESHLLLVTEYFQTRDKEIPFVGNGHSALSQHNPLTEQVSRQPVGQRRDNAALMGVHSNMWNRILSLCEHGYLCNMEYGPVPMARCPNDSDFRFNAVLYDVTAMT